jgi:hypothetical protein
VFDITLGLAGFVTVAGHGVLTDYVNQDGRFQKEIDDPKGIASSPALQIISVPIFCTQDSEDTPGPENLSNFPRCVVQLINKKPKGNFGYQESKVAELLRKSNKFTNEDLEKMESLAFVIGRVHQVVNKVEQLHSMKNLSNQIMDISSTLQSHIDVSQGNMKTMGVSLK